MTRARLWGLSHLSAGDTETEFGEICCVHMNLAEQAQKEMVRYCSHEDRLLVSIMEFLINLGMYGSRVAQSVHWFDYWLDDRGFDSRKGQIIFLLVTHLTSYAMINGVCNLGGRADGSWGSLSVASI